MRGARYNKVLYLGLADAIKRARDLASQDYLCDETPTDNEMRVIGVNLAARQIADAFASVSNGFDRELFLRNCGMEK